MKITDEDRQYGFDVDPITQDDVYEKLQQINSNAEDMLSVLRSIEKTLFLLVLLALVSLAKYAFNWF